MAHYNECKEAQRFSSRCASFVSTDSEVHCVFFVPAAGPRPFPITAGFLGLSYRRKGRVFRNVSAAPEHGNERNDAFTVFADLQPIRADGSLTHPL